MNLQILRTETVLSASLLIAGATGAYFLKKLSFSGALTGALSGFLVFSGAGFTGLAMLAAFFMTGTAATSYKRAEKGKIHIRLEQRNGRNAGQVLANAGMAAFMGLLGMLNPAHINLYGIMMAASLASASSDTLSSELGSLYGKNFYNILSFKKDLRGQDGVISLEGTFIGIIGSALIAILYDAGAGKNFLIIAGAGMLGNLTDSVLGAGLERKGLLKNDMVNFLSTLTAATIAALLVTFFD